MFRISVSDQISGYHACIAFAVRSIVMEREPVGSRHTAYIFIRFFSTQKIDQKSNFGVEMADECVVAGEPPYCRQTDARARKRAYNVCCACQRAVVACSAASARSSTLEAALERKLSHR